MGNMEDVQLEGLNSVQTAEELMKRVVDHTSNVVNADRCTLFLYDEKKDILWSKIAGGTKSSFSIQLGQGIAGSAGETKEVEMVRNAYNDNRFNPEFDKKI